MKVINARLSLTLTVVLLSHIVSAQVPLQKPVFKQSKQVFDQSYRTWETALADLDSDGDLDLVFTCLGPKARILFNDGTGYFIPSEQEFPGNTHGVDIADIDLDGDLDLFFAILEESQSCPVYFNDGHGVFEGSDPDFTVGNSESVQLFDIENDGDYDAFLWWKSLLYINDGTGAFTLSDRLLPELVSFAELNGDGFIDMVEFHMGRGFTVLLNDHSGEFVEYAFYPMSDAAFCRLAFADLDNDGDNDIAYTNGDEEEQHPSGVLVNDGTGRFSDGGQELSSVQYGYIGIGDLNNDGFPDLVITSREGPLRIWLNNGKAEFVDSGIELGKGGYWHNCMIEDLDNDGDNDVFVTKLYQGSHGLWFNETPEWTPSR